MARMTTRAAIYTTADPSGDRGSLADGSVHRALSLWNADRLGEHSRHLACLTTSIRPQG